jgi:PAS domain-containing protein
VITFIDIDALKQSQFSLQASEIALNVSESKFKVLAENIQDVFWMRTPDMHRTEYVSPACQRIWGLDMQTLTDDPRAFLQVVHPDDRNRVADRLREHARGKWNLEYRVEKQGHPVRWIHDRGFPIHVGIVLLDGQGRAIQTNAPFQRMLACDGRNLQLILMDRLIHADDRPAFRQLNRAIFSGTRDVLQLSLRLLVKNGDALPVNLTVIAVRDATRQPAYAIGRIETLPRRDSGKD